MKRSLRMASSFSRRRPGFRGVLNSVQSSPRPKTEARRPKEGRNPNCRIRSHRRGATAHRIKPFSDFGARPNFGLRASGFGFQGCGPTLEHPRPGADPALPGFPRASGNRYNMRVMSTVAEQLRQARESQHLTEQQIVEITKIRTDHLRAIEEGNYDRSEEHTSELQSRQ